MPRLGEKCPNCKTGIYKVLNTRVSDEQDVRVRWLGCGCCGYRPPDNKQVVPLAAAPRRRTMRRLNLRRR
jgi:transcriptional regulator NrdR family protein